MNNVSTIALARMEISEPVIGSANFPTVRIGCIGNFAVFVTSLLWGRLDLEMGVKDVLATIRGPKLEDVNGGFGLTTSMDYSKASMVTLSNHTPNLSIKQLMTYISYVYNMHSILLQCFPIKFSALKKLDNSEKCKWIIFNTVEYVVGKNIW